MRLINIFVNSISPSDCISYEAFEIWMVMNEERFESIYALGESELGENGWPDYPDNETLNAEYIFLCFQAFFASFIRIDYETITLRRAYESLSHPIRKCLSLINPDYGDLSLIINDDHGNKIIDIMTSVRKNLGQGRMKLIEMPEIMPSSKDYSFSKPLAVDSIYRRPLIYEKLVFPSENGIGKGANYVFYRPMRFPS